MFSENWKGILIETIVHKYNIQYLRYQNNFKIIRLLHKGGACALNGAKLIIVSAFFSRIDTLSLG